MSHPSLSTLMNSLPTLPSMKQGRLSHARVFAVMLLAIALDLEFSARAFEPQFRNATLQVGATVLSPTEIISPWRDTYTVGSNLFYVSERTVQHPANAGSPAWTNHSTDGASLNWLTASTNTAYLLGYRTGKDQEFLGYDSPARLRCLDLQTGKWLPDLPVSNTTPDGFETTNVLAALANDEGVFVLTGLRKKNAPKKESSWESSIDGYNLCYFQAGSQQPVWSKQFASTGERPYTGGYLWGVPPPAYAGSNIQPLSWLGDRLLVCPEAMQPVYCIDPYMGREVWRLDRVWELQRGFIGPSVWQHYISRFGIEEDFELEHTNINDVRAAFDKQYRCALVGGPISVPLNFTRQNGHQTDTHSIFVAVTRGPAREWAGYLSDCLLYEFGDGGNPVSMGTLPQAVEGSQYCVRGSDIIWKCQNETFARVSPARSAPMMSMGPGGSDCTLNLIWLRRVQYENPKSWFTAGKGGDPAAFGENFAYCVPAGGYVLRKTNSLYSFPIAAIDLSTGVVSNLALNVPFTGPFPVPDSNVGTETDVDGTKLTRAINWHLLAISRLATRGSSLEITLATEKQTSTTLAFDVENALLTMVPVPRRPADDSAETARKKASSIPAKERNEALLAAARDDDVQFVKALLDAGADPKFSSKDGLTALMIAADSGSAEMVDILIAAGSDVNAADKQRSGSTVLMSAAGSNRDASRKVRALLKSGADAKRTDEYGETALMMAIGSDNVDAVEDLIRAGSNVSRGGYQGWTPLMHAAGRGRARIVSILLQAGADKNDTDERGTTALMLAAENVDTAPAIDVLLKAGADPNLKDKQGRTALQIAERSGKLHHSGAEEIINLLKPVTKSAH